MGRVQSIVRCILAAAALTLGLAASAGAASERIYTFKSHIIIHADATMTVTETITVNATGNEIRRGIIREFPTTYKDRLGNRIRVGFRVKEVLKNGYPENYSLETASNGVKVRIGRKEVFLNPGVYTYRITYETDRQLGYFKDYDELYWNVNGNGWTFPIDSVEALIELPPKARVVQHAGYTGPQGAQGKDFIFEDKGDGRVYFKTTRRFGPKEGLTVAVAWPKGLVHQPSAAEEAQSFIKDNLGTAVALIWILVMVFYYLKVWNRVGRDPAKGTIIPLFSPPSGFSPEAVRYLMRMGYDNKTFAAALVNMAVKGHLIISETDDGYSLKRLPKGKEPLSSSEIMMMSRLFGGSSTLAMTQTNHAKFSGAKSALEASLDQQLDKIYFNTNSKYVFGGVLLTLLAFASYILLSPQVESALLSFFFVTMMGGMAVFLGTLVIRQWLMALGGKIKWGNLLTAILITPFAAMFVIVFLVGFFSDMEAPFLVTGFIFGLAMAVNGTFYYLLKAPTLEGRKTMDQIEGFKLYLSVAEKDRLNLLNPPERTPELFEKYLPYALALDVEQEWCEQFADILAQASVDGEAYHPVWYHGTSWDRFNASTFSSSLGSSMASAISSASTAPGSSSGSGGGGSSGGGGGGGGGSGW